MRLRFGLIALTLAFAVWRLSFSRIPLEFSSAAMCRDLAHCFLVSLVWLMIFVKPIRLVGGLCFAALTVLEAVGFAG